MSNRYGFKEILRHAARVLVLLTLCLPCALLAADAYAAPKEKPLPVFRIVVIGDRFSSGYLLKPENTYTSLLQPHIARKAKRCKLEMNNFSSDGTTATTAVAQLKNILAYRPDMAVVALGGADALNKTDPTIVKMAIDQVLAGLTRNNVYVLLVGFKAPAGMSVNYEARYSQMHIELARKYKLNFISDLLAGVQNNPMKTLADRTFPDEAGMVQISENIKQKLTVMFNDVKAKKCP